MYKLTKYDNNNAQTVSNLKVPFFIDINCPHCHRLATFQPSNHTIDHVRSMVSSSAKCPGCQNTIHVFSINNGQSLKDVYIYPGPTAFRIPIDTSAIPNEGIKKAYEGVIRVFNSGEYIPAAAACRRALEGVVKSLLPEDKKSLSLQKAFDEVIQQNDLAGPVKKMGHLIRVMGNLGAHFDDQRELNKKDLDDMIDLFEYFVEYMFVVPKNIEKLNDRVQEVKNGNPPIEEL